MSESEQQSESTQQNTNRHSHRRGLTWGAGIALYLGAIWLIGWDRIRDAMIGVDGWTVGAMSLVTISALWIRVLKWRVALGPGASSVGLFFLSKAAGEWSPARMGEFSPLLIRRFRTARMAAWIVVDRVLEMVTTLGLGVLGLAFVGLPNRGALLLAGILLCVGIIAALALLANTSYWERMAARFSPGGRIHRFASLVPGIAHEVRTFGRTAVLTGALTVLAGCLDVWGGMLLYGALGHPISFQVSAASKGVHAIVSALPFTPNATGVPYFATAALIHEAGHVPTPALAAGVALGVLLTNLVFWGSLGIGAADFRKRNRTDG